MISLYSVCVLEAAFVSIAWSWGVVFWSKPNLCVLRWRTDRDGGGCGGLGGPGETPQAGLSILCLICPFPHVPSILLEPCGCVVCQAHLLVVNKYPRVREVNWCVDYTALILFALERSFFFMLAYAYLQYVLSVLTSFCVNTQSQSSEPVLHADYR